MDKQYTLLKIALILFFVGLITTLFSIVWLGFLLHEVIGLLLTGLMSMFIAIIVIAIIVGDD